MTTLSIGTSDFGDLFESLQSVSDNLSKEIGVCLWETARAVKSNIAKEVQKELAVPQRAIKAVLTEKRDYEALEAHVVISPTAAIPLHEFKTYETKRGVSTRVSAKKDRYIIPGAFIVEKFGGKVFKRRSGEKRKLGHHLKGPTVLGSFVHSPGLSDRVVQAGTDELAKQVSERVRYLNLKAAGGLNWQQPEYVSDQATGEN